MCSVLALSIIIAAVLCILAAGGFIVAALVSWWRADRAWRELDRDVEPRHFDGSDRP
jgi:hypothetical protein